MLRTRPDLAALQGAVSILVSKFACLAFVILFASATYADSAAPTAEELGLRVPEGFTITRFAGDELAHDIFSMTIDSLGRVVVSGPGYIKILIDDNLDGVADRAVTFATEPAAGTQGMYFVGRDLLCAGGEGLIRFRDRDGDDRADGPPDVFLKIKTGNEHDLHAIRKGPDGWWYLITGNTAGVNPQYAAMSTSPVKHPHAGVILRMKPDLTEGEIFAHGFRNAYDFDFASSGEVFAFESDGENVKSLPWYEPSKLFHVLPGSHQGWVSNNWIRPDHFLDAPPVVREFGRGSPTGVVTYRHTAFPEKYQNSIFLLDWTYGRVYAVNTTRDGSTWTGEPEEFVWSEGQHGFAPTDVEIGVRGEMYICVGGRGTQGEVYCIRPTDSQVDAPAWPQSAGPITTAEDKLNLCLRAPQPLSSWSRQVWEPLAAELEAQPFLSAAIDQQRPVAERLRAIEILTDRFSGINSATATELAADDDAMIRAKAVWSIGRTHSKHPPMQQLEPYFSDSDPLVIRHLMEALQGADEPDLTAFIDLLAAKIGSEDRLVQQAAMRALTRASLETVHRIAQISFPKGWDASIPVAGSFAVRTEGYSAYTIDIGLRILKSKNYSKLHLAATRLIQLGLGDVGPDPKNGTSVFDGYSSQIDLQPFQADLVKLGNALAAIYPTQDALVDQELERIFSMIKFQNDQVFEEILLQISTTTNPIKDIHRLIVIAQLPGKRSQEQRDFIAQAILNLDVKIQRFKLQQDSSWGDRVLEICLALVDHDSELPTAFLKNPVFGRSGHILFVSMLSESDIEACSQRFWNQVKRDPKYRWTPDLVFLVGATDEPEALQMLRDRFSDLSLRSAILTFFAADPAERDRELYTTAIASGILDSILISTEALQLLPPSQDPVENVVLVKSLRQLGIDGEERKARDQIVEILRRNFGVKDSYILGRDGIAQTEAITNWISIVEQKFPEEFAQAGQADSQSLAELKTRLDGIAWENGDPINGEVLYQTRSCTQCHGKTGAIGPDLTGVAGRFSRDDLFTAIVFPDQDVSPRYQGMKIVTSDGLILTGMLVHEGVDGVVLRDAKNKTYRLKTDDIELKQPMTQSMMPSGLLNGTSDQEFADLYAYLKGLGVKSTAAIPTGMMD